MNDASDQKPARDNRAAQLDPQNDRYHRSRGVNPDGAAARADAVRTENQAKGRTLGPVADSKPTSRGKGS